MSDAPPGAELDALAELVFGGEQGEARLAPLLSRFERSVGRIRSDDAGADAWHAVRTDWALCDARVPGRSSGESWAWLAVTGRIEGVTCDESLFAFGNTVASVFEVWPGRPVWIADVLGGLVAPLAYPIHGLEERVAGPVARWDARVAVTPAGAVLARRPLDFPEELLGELSIGLGRPFTSRAKALTRGRSKHLEWLRRRPRRPLIER